MKRLILLSLTMVMMSCGNKKVPFDYNTLPSEWKMLTFVDGEGYFIDEDAEILTIEGKTLTHWYIAAGEKWELEIIDAYQKGDTIIFNLKSSDENKYDYKFIWLGEGKDLGCAEWIFDEDNYNIFVSSERQSEFLKVESFDEDTELIDVVSESENPKDLVRPNEIIIESLFGDLNNDGEDDCVIITKQTKKNMAFVKNQFDEVVDRNRRGILIAFKNAELYTTVLSIPDCFSSENEDGGVYFPPELSVEIVKGNLRIHYGHGRYGWWRYTFRYRNNDFELIGYDQSNNRGPITESRISINFLTKKEQTQTNTNTDPELEGGEEIFEEVWQDIIIDKLVKLTDIECFDEFYIGDIYSKNED